jgi:hypothetical protein
VSNDETIRIIQAAYDRGASLPTIIFEAGSDEATLRLIRSRLGVSLQTLRAEAALLEARCGDASHASSHALMRAENTGRTIDGITPEAATAELNRRERPGTREARHA